jgi:hypothetical protein
MRAQASPGGDQLARVLVHSLIYQQHMAPWSAQVPLFLCYIVRQHTNTASSTVGRLHEGFREGHTGGLFVLWPDQCPACLLVTQLYAWLVI